MTTVGQIAEFLERRAPAALAESWDNVGLLVGDRAGAVTRVMTCLTITPPSAAEAITERAELIVAHHPLPFRPLARLTTDTMTGQLLWQLIRAGISVYSPHTAYDSAEQGINEQLADALGLCDVRPLVPRADGPLGAGRCGRLAKRSSLAELAERLKSRLCVAHVQCIGDAQRMVERIAVACGSAGELLDPAIALGCECFVTGEARFHACLEAEARGASMLLVGHFASERLGVERLASDLAAEFAGIAVWASRTERDPIGQI